MITVTTLLTVYNRRESTLNCLRSLKAQLGSGETFLLRAIVVDDSSTDDSAAAVRAEFSTDFVEVIDGPGDLYWARGMSLAQAAATPHSPDVVLWLNDDVALDQDAVSRAVAAVEASSFRSIIVGATRDATGQDITYTGARLRTARPGSLVPVEPGDQLVEIDTFNGNFVAIPREVYRSLGGVDDQFEHAYGDIDYGLRARDAGIASFLLPHSIGICERNPVDGTWRDPALPRRARIRSLLSRKGYPAKSHWRFNRAHGGVMAPVYFSATYARALGQIVLGRRSA